MKPRTGKEWSYMLPLWSMYSLYNTTTSLLAYKADCMLAVHPVVQLAVLAWQVLGQPDRTSHPCFSPVFDLELDAKLASQNHLDRCFSQQQLGGGEGATAGNSLLQQILALCRCASPVQVQVGGVKGGCVPGAFTMMQECQALSVYQPTPYNQVAAAFVCCVALQICVADIQRHMPKLLQTGSRDADSCCICYRATMHSLPC